MKTSDNNSNDSFIIQPASHCQIGNFQVEIDSYLCQFADVNYFQVTINNPDNQENSGKSGLLRIGSLDGALRRELQLRKVLGNHKMISELLVDVEEEPVKLFPSSQQPKNQSEEDSSNSLEETNTTEIAEEVQLTEESQSQETTSEELSEPEKTDQHSSDNSENNHQDTVGIESETENTEYLDEEYYEEEPVGFDFNSSTPKLILLSYLPEETETLTTWLTKDKSLKESLLVASQICQFCRLVYQHKKSLIQIFPKFIQMGTPVQFFDLTGVYSTGENLTSGFMGEYSAPEIAYQSNCTISEQMSTYTVAALLYHAIHHKLPYQQSSKELEIEPISSIYQILKLSLSSIPEERFSLTQLLELLVENRKSIEKPQIHWEVATNSIVGLSPSRLQNEDSYGIREHHLNNSDSLILGVVADGMGGMAQGEIASKIAVQTVLETPITEDLTNPNNRAKWLISLVEKANNSIAKQVKDGGTTISLVMALGRELMIAHVGDSRIYLLREGKISQLSEDHSMVAMLVASGEITYEESQNHPDRNVLIKSLGSKRRLSPGYVQDLSRFGGDSSMVLEDGDILILCSDGVWDLVSTSELAEIFTREQTLQSSVDVTINQVLQQGANDNATIMALKYRMRSSQS